MAMTAVAAAGRGGMPAELAARLHDYRTRRAFDAGSWIDAKCRVFNRYMRSHHAHGCVVGVTGGLDSAVAIALARAAQSTAASPIRRVVGACMPADASSHTLSRGVEAVRSCAGELVLFDYEQLQIDHEVSAHVEVALGAVHSDAGASRRHEEQPPRPPPTTSLRASFLHHIASVLTRGNCASVVVGSDTRDDGIIRAGTGVGGFVGSDVNVGVQVLSDIHRSEVIQVARALGVPASIIAAAESGGACECGACGDDTVRSGHRPTALDCAFVELFVGAYLPMTPEQKHAFTHSLPPATRRYFEHHASRALALHHRRVHRGAASLSLGSAHVAVPKQERSYQTHALRNM